MTSIAITGHRPKDLPGLNKFELQSLANLRFDEHETETNFVIHTGGALGTDQWIAEWALDKNNPHFLNADIAHILHTPFTIPIMTKMWQLRDRETLEHIAKNSNDICSKMLNRYDVAQYQRRNECMVDNADIVWAFWLGKQYGGTWNCIQYALRVGKPVINAFTGKIIS